MRIKKTGLVVVAIALATAGRLHAADTADEISELKKQIEALDQKVRALERNRELEQEAAESAKKNTPRLTAGEEGFSFSSANTNFVLKLGAHLQADGRFYLGDHIPINDTFLLRRVRPIFEGTIFKDYDYRLMLDYGANTATASTVQDAYINAHYWPQFQIQAGKFKPPVGLERLQSDVNVRFIERGYPTGLVPNRDVGLQLHGVLFDGVLNYQAGIFNGVADGGSGDIELADDHKDYAGRIFVHPFKSAGVEPLRNLGLGVAGTYGNQNGTLPRYVTPGQQTFFSYATNATAAGTHWRLVPQGYWYWRSLGVLGEYVVSSQKIRTTAMPATTIHNDAWQVAATYILTGEANSFQGVKPHNPFSPANGGWGALELAGRFGRLEIDNEAFPALAAAGSASKATSWGAGVNWYLNRNLKLSLDYEQTYFKDGSSKRGTVTAQDEKIVFSRIQLAF